MLGAGGLVCSGGGVGCARDRSMGGGTSEGMAGRFSTGILAAYCVLVPVSLAAEPAPSAEDPLQPRVDQGAGEFEDAFSRAGPVTRELEQLHRRIDELETAQTARDDASRWIIRDALSTL